MENPETDENNYVYYFAFLGIAIILGYFSYVYFYSDIFLENIERKLSDFKENVAFYTNQMLLKTNMEGDAIKTTQTNPFSNFSNDL